jgi:hypothetical protein
MELLLAPGWLESMSGRSGQQACRRDALAAGHCFRTYGELAVDRRKQPDRRILVKYILGANGQDEFDVLASQRAEIDVDLGELSIVGFIPPAERADVAI